MLLDYAKPARPMPPAAQWLLGVPFGVVVVVTVSFVLGISQGPVGAVCGGLAAAAGLGLWANRLRRGGYYRHLAAAVATGVALGLRAAGLATAAVPWG